MPGTDFEALARELIAARKVVLRNRANHIAVRALCNVLKRHLQPSDPAHDGLTALFAAVERGEHLDEIEVSALMSDATDLLEFCQSQPSHEAAELDARARRSLIKLVVG
jgi:hypothetical protein